MSLSPTHPTRPARLPDRAPAARPGPWLRLLRRYRVQFVLLLGSSAAAGTLAAVGTQTGGTANTAAGLGATLVLFLATALQTLVTGARQLVATEEAGQATGETATELQTLVADRLPSLLEYLGRLADTDATDRDRLVEGLENLVSDSAASLYGRPGLRAVVYHLRGAALAPGNHRPGWAPSVPATLTQHAQSGRRAFDLLTDPSIVWVDNQSDPAHHDQLLLRPDDSFQSFIRVPIIAGDRAFGLLWVDGKLSKSLTEADTPALGLLARLLGIGFALGGHQYLEIASADDDR